MGVLRSVSLCFRKPGETAMGLQSSEGKVPDAGVCNDDAVLARLSKPAAAKVAVAVAEVAMLACRRLCKRVTGEAKD